MTTENSTTTSSTTTTTTTTTTTELPSTTSTYYTPTSQKTFFEAGFNAVKDFKDSIFETTTTTQAPNTDRSLFAFDFAEEEETTSAPGGFFGRFGAAVTEKLGNIADLRPDPTSNIPHEIENINEKFNILPHAEAFSDLSTIAPFHLNATSCERVNIMGTIVPDSTPYLYPFIIEYSLIGAVVIYVMWKHIGRFPKYSQDEDLEHRLEVMLTRRAQALAQANSGRVDCVGASKGLFFGLLLLVGSLICLILFFVLVQHEQFRILAYYLADASHGVLLIFAILAILIGFCR